MTFESISGDLSALAARLSEIGGELSAAIHLGESANLVGQAMPGGTAGGPTAGAAGRIDLGASSLAANLSAAGDTAVNMESAFGATDAQGESAMANGSGLDGLRYQYGAS